MPSGHVAGRRAAGAGRHQLPEERMIPVAAAVVAHGRADVFGHAVHVANQIVEALVVQLGMLVERVVQIRHVGLMMLAVMNLHRLGVDVRFERGKIVRQRGQRMGHVGSPRGTVEGLRGTQYETPTRSTASDLERS